MNCHCWNYFPNYSTPTTWQWGVSAESYIIIIIIFFLQGSSVSYNKAAIKRSPVLNKIVFALFAKNKN